MLLVESLNSFHMLCVIHIWVRFQCWLQQILLSETSIPQELRISNSPLSSIGKQSYGLISNLLRIQMSQSGQLSSFPGIMTSVDCAVKRNKHEERHCHQRPLIDDL